eukprot:m.45928 g.45928  ORF g.45928 m.45928 type:complete len:102 (+) comp33645_c0_seq1:679-984(+)
MYSPARYLALADCLCALWRKCSLGSKYHENLELIVVAFVWHLMGHVVLALLAYFFTQCIVQVGWVSSMRCWPKIDKTNINEFIPLQDVDALPSAVINDQDP